MRDEILEFRSLTVEKVRGSDFGIASTCFVEEDRSERAEEVDLSEPLEESDRLELSEESDGSEPMDSAGELGRTGGVVVRSFSSLRVRSCKACIW